MPSSWLLQLNILLLPLTKLSKLSAVSKRACCLSLCSWMPDSSGSGCCAALVCVGRVTSVLINPAWLLVSLCSSLLLPALLLLSSKGLVEIVCKAAGAKAAPGLPQSSPVNKGPGEMMVARPLEGSAAG